jgi:hypothetical protein
MTTMAETDAALCATIDAKIAYFRASPTVKQYPAIHGLVEDVETQFEAFKQLPAADTLACLRSARVLLELLDHIVTEIELLGF